MYECLIMVDSGTDISVEQLAGELRGFYAAKPGAPSKIRTTSEEVSLEWPDYVLAIRRSSAAHVLDESEEIAREHASQHPNCSQISRCHTRFELSGDDDPNMDHFNDYLYVGEALLRLGKVYRFEVDSGAFLE